MSATLTRHQDQATFPASTGTSMEASRLIQHAISCVDQNNAAAIELMRMASSLLQAPAAEEQSAASPCVVPGSLAPWQINRVRAYIEDQISRPISLQEIASVARLSISYFASAFKLSFGTSPHSYIITRRVAFAKYRMQHSDAPLCEIALDCGLADQAHLSRVFRRVTGTTPSAWRRLSRQPVAIRVSN